MNRKPKIAPSCRYKIELSTKHLGFRAGFLTAPYTRTIARPKELSWPGFKEAQKAALKIAQLKNNQWNLNVVRVS